MELFESTWKRARWFTHKNVRASVDIPAGIPHPGKGENSWDCGEDRTYGLTTKADTVEKAIAAVVESSLRDRRRYGGDNWTPSEKKKRRRS